MTLLFDTHLLIWSLLAPERLSQTAQDLITDPKADLAFSAVNIWEVAIKHALRKPGFDVDPVEMRDELIAIGYRELPVTSDHTIRVAGLPPHHKDPFDRLLIAQARVEAFTLVTADRLIARYPGPILKV